MDFAVKCQQAVFARKTVLQWGFPQDGIKQKALVKSENSAANHYVCKHSKWLADVERFSYVRYLQDVLTL
jgi:hypothetical protein